MVNDILLDDAGDLAVTEGGDLAVGYSDTAHIADLLESEPGHWKQWPLAGVGLWRWLNGPVDAERLRLLKREILLQLRYDGAEGLSVSWREGKLEVHGEYAV